MTLVIPTGVASNRLVIKNNVENSDQSTVSDRGLPDLIIKDIFTGPGWYPFVTDYLVRVKNIGEKEADGWIDINVKITVEWKLLGIIPMKETYNIETGFRKFPPIQPGETEDFAFTSNEYFNDRGKCSFSAVINPDHTMEESNYSNNFYEEIISNSYKTQNKLYLDKNNEEPMLKINDNEFLLNEFYFVIYYGKIVYNGEEYVGFPYYEVCYNVTPINLKGLGFIWLHYYGFFPLFGNAPFDPWYIPKSKFHGFVGKNYIFGLAYDIS